MPVSAALNWRVFENVHSMNEGTAYGRYVPAGLRVRATEIWYGEQERQKNTGIPSISLAGKIQERSGTQTAQRKDLLWGTGSLGGH